MVSVVSALDNTQQVQLGENGHREFGWSNKLTEKILQLSFQLTRTDTDRVNNLGNKYYECLVDALNNPDGDLTLLGVLYRLMLHTRDIINGKGEYALFYELLLQWVKLSIRETTKDNEKKKKIEILVNSAVYSLVNIGTDTHPYGSWKDMKYILEALRKEYRCEAPNLCVFKYIIMIIVYQLKLDVENSEKGNNISLLGRWVPREKSKKFGFFLKRLTSNFWVFL